MLLVIPAGSTVSLTGDAANGFLAVVYNGTSGWAYASFLDTSDPAPDPDPGSSTGSATTTSALNLRAGPSTSDTVIQVLPAGSTVTLTGNSANGFLSVASGNVAGWAFAAYLDTDGSGPAPDPGAGDGDVRVISDLNLRSGPSTSDSVRAVMPAGSFVTLTGESANGFLSVSYNGIAGWAYAAFLDTGDNQPPAPDPGSGTGAATTTTALNLRGGPGTGYPVLAVIPAAATVSTTGDPQNGFYPVTFGGRAGWVAGAYLAFGSDPGGIRVVAAPVSPGRSLAVPGGLRRATTAPATTTAGADGSITTRWTLPARMGTRLVSPFFLQPPARFVGSIPVLGDCQSISATATRWPFFTSP